MGSTTCTGRFIQYEKGRDDRHPGIWNVSGRCNRCAGCIAYRKQAWTGRVMAELLTARSAWYVTLTYGPEAGARAALFDYSDIQKFLKVLRSRMARRRDPETGLRDPAKLRYICAGEVGSSGGRTHWHLIIFFDREVPTPYIPSGERWSAWPHGFTRVSHLSLGNLRTCITKVRYVVKYCFKAYAVKRDEKSTDNRFSASFVPAIGAKYFREKAVEAAIAGAQLPESFELAGVRRRAFAGEATAHEYFPITGTGRRLYVMAYLDAWSLLLDRLGTVPRLTQFMQFAVPTAERRIAVMRDRLAGRGIGPYVHPDAKGRAWDAADAAWEAAVAARLKDLSLPLPPSAQTAVLGADRPNAFGQLLRGPEKDWAQIAADQVAAFCALRDAVPDAAAFLDAAEKPARRRGRRPSSPSAGPSDSAAE